MDPRFFRKYADLITEAQTEVDEVGQLDEIFGFGKKPLGSRERFAQDANRVEKMSTADQNAHHQRVADQINAHLGKYAPGKHQPVTASQAMSAHVNALQRGSKANEIEVGDAQETGRILNKTHDAIGDVKKYHGKIPKEVSEENSPGHDRSWHQGASDARDGIDPAQSKAKPVGRDEEDTYNSGYNSYKSLPAKRTR